MEGVGKGEGERARERELVRGGGSRYMEREGGRRED